MVIHEQAYDAPGEAVVIELESDGTTEELYSKMSEQFKDYRDQFDKPASEKTLEDYLTFQTFQGYVESLEPVDEGSTSATAHQYRLPDYPEVFESDPALFDGESDREFGENTSYNWETGTLTRGSDIYTVNPVHVELEKDKPNFTVSENGDFLLWGKPIDDLIKEGVLELQLPPEPSTLDEWMAANPNGTAQALVDWMEWFDEHADHDHEANPHRRRLLTMERLLREISLS